jgi:hypothetical protein
VFIGIIFNLIRVVKRGFMSQHSRNQPSDRQGDSNNGSGDRSGRNPYEGFEGMNYEQRRQPYNPQQANQDRNSNGSGGNSGEQQEER